MDLPIRTLRQKVAAINRRLYFDRRERIALMTWQTRQLATFTAMGYWTDGKNPAISEAQSLAFDKIEKAELKEAETFQNDEPFDPENPPEANVSPGSFERFLGSMGNPSRWAGR